MDVSKCELNKDEYNDHVHLTYARKEELKHTHKETYKDRPLIILPFNRKIIQAGLLFRKQSKAKSLNGDLFICKINNTKWNISPKILNIL